MHAPNTPHCCEEMASHLADNEVAIEYLPRFREYGIRIVDRGTAIQLIRFCPWCGSPLPSSLRDEWFARLEAMGLEPDDPRMPDALNTDAWWRVV